MLIASVPIDVDHLPAEFIRRDALYATLPRPYTNALWLLVLLAVIAAVAYRRARVTGGARTAVVASVFAGLAWGVGAHFLRDLAPPPSPCCGRSATPGSRFRTGGTWGPCSSW